MPDAGIADGAVYTSAFHDTYVRQQVIATVTSGTRPAHLDGRVIYETDTDRTLQSDGTGWVIMWEPEQTYTPTLTQSAAVTKTVNSARYQRRNGRCVGRFDLSATATGTAANVVRVTLPIAPNVIGGRSYQHVVGVGAITDASASLQYRGLMVVYSGSDVALTPMSANTAEGSFLGGSTFTAALASTDVIIGTFDYEMTTRYS